MAGESVLLLARVKLEAVTPLSISTGQPDNVFDTALVRDANGLPAIPGTALAGVLRHLWLGRHGEASADALFGHQTGSEGAPSRVAVSWGHLCDSQGRVADGLLLGDAAKRLTSDPLFATALAQVDAPVFRNRVRLTHRGAAADTGKFDRAVLPAGNRFIVELRLWSGAGHDDTEFDRLLSLLAHPGLRVGGATRAGLGRLKTVDIAIARLDMEQAADRARLKNLSRDLNDWRGLAAYTPTPRPAEQADWLRGTLRLEPRGAWRIGQGDAPPSGAEKPADLLPVVESRIDWAAGAGGYTPAMLLVPASSIKGALAHRMAFHARRLSDTWRAAAETAHDLDEKPGAVVDLFGEAKNGASADDDEGFGKAGCLYIDDAFVSVSEVKLAQLMHNAIDRFTGGVRDRVLYDEEVVLGGVIEIELALDTQRLRSADTRAALHLAIRDLCEGRLALGSRSTTGNGFFCGRLSGPLQAWLDPSAQLQGEAA
ncbi:RAMP superfamily CRISPR-associated protein [Metallibacterium scheffleri]|nr:RAMP superfamily CRISPR-associated protein [Metallibacterium scheffleri]